MVLTALRCGIVRSCGLSCGSVLRWSSPGLLGSSPLLSALLGSPGFSCCLCGREESGNGPRDRRIEKLWPRLNLIWRSILGFDDDADDDNEDENDDNDGELKRDVCAVLCCPGVARLSWGLLASPVLVSAPCALLGSPGLSCALLCRARPGSSWHSCAGLTLAFSSALLGSPVLCSPVLGPALSCARLCSPVLSCFWLTVVDC